MSRFIPITLITSLLTSSTLLASDNNSLFNSLGVNLGKSYISYDQKDISGSIILGNEPDKSFNSIEVFTTLNPLTSFCKENNIKPYLSFTHSRNDDLKHQYLLAGANKYFTLDTSNSLSLYTGILLGYGQMNWRYDPLNSSTNKNVDANSFLGGVQVGISYPIATSYSIGLNGKYLFSDYETELKPTTSNHSTITHDRVSSIGVSLEYSF